VIRWARAVTTTLRLIETRDLAVCGALVPGAMRTSAMIFNWRKLPAIGARLWPASRGQCPVMGVVPE
jgi:hypothetical protein